MKGKELLKDEEVQKFVRRYIILYGVQLGVYTVVAICMQVWWQYFVFMISFIALRSFAGGYHAKRESVCVVQSGAIVLAACLTMKFIVISMQTVICIALLSGIMIFFHAPIEAEQKKLTDNERKKYRKTSRIVWIVEDIDSHSQLFRFVVKDRGGTSDNSMVLGSCAGYDGSHP